jgi:hypothetical protein
MAEPGREQYQHLLAKHLAVLRLSRQLAFEEG